MWARKTQPGFTIVELLIVIVVIAILATVTIIGYNGVSQQARASAVQSDLAQAVRKIELAKVEGGLGLYPTDLPGGITSSAGSTFVYSYDPTLNRFCVTTSIGDTAYYASTSDKSPREGRCQDNNRLVGWWKLNGNTTDDSELGNNGTSVGTVTPTTGQNGQTNAAYTLNGSTSYIATNVSSQANDLFATDGQSWTATVWFRYNTQTGNDDMVLGRGGGTGSAATFGLAVDGIQRLRAVLRGTLTVIATVPDNDWHFAAITWDGTTARGYFDLSEPVLLNVGTAGLQTTNKFLIGATANGTGGSFRTLNGAVDDVRLYTRALGTAELADMYERGAE